MKRIFLPSVLLFLIFSNQNTFAQHNFDAGLKAITINAVQAQLEFLASDWTEGRETGTPGAYMAADYIASMFKLYGLKPGGDMDRTTPSLEDRIAGIESKEFQTYYQNFSLIRSEAGDDMKLALIDKSGSFEEIIEFNYRTDFDVNLGTTSREISAAVVFVGYGIKDEDKGYNDFDDVDVEGRIILRVSGFPGHKDTNSSAYKKFHPEGRYGYWYLMRAKNDAARENGAIGIIEVNTGVSPELRWAVNTPFRYNSDYYEGDVPLRENWKRLSLPGKSIDNDIPDIDVTERTANEILNNSGIDLEQFENKMEENPQSGSRSLTGKKVSIKIDVETEIIKARNVVGVLEGEVEDEFIVVGGHYDHTGTEKGYIWNGADDNASGTVGVLTIARAAASMGIKPHKTIIFCAWSGEEKGLLGSRYYVQALSDDISKVHAYLNYDMIARDNSTDTLGNECWMSYTSAAPILEELTIKHNEDAGLGLEIDLRPSDNPRGGSDHSSFAAKDVPIFYFMAGFHPDYHQPTDTPDKANYDKMSKIIKIGFMNVWHLANMTGTISQ